MFQNESKNTNTVLTLLNKDSIYLTAKFPDQISGWFFYIGKHILELFSSLFIYSVCFAHHAS